MPQTAIVKRIVSAGVAEVSLLRQMECALGCKDCEGCSQKPKEELLALAGDPIGVQAGDVVEVQPVVGGASSAALLVYLLPCVTLILGYLLAARLGLAEWGRIAAAIVFIALGLLPARLVDRAIRARGAPEFTIVSVRR